MTPRILLPDATPVSLLASLGDEALDWLLAPGLPLWLTDMVIIEITREPDEGADRRKETRAAAADWLRRNRGRYRIENTPEGKAYLAAMQAWEALGLAGQKLKEAGPLEADGADSGMGLGFGWQAQ